MLYKPPCQAISIHNTLVMQVECGKHQSVGRIFAKANLILHLSLQIYTLALYKGPPGAYYSMSASWTQFCSGDLSHRIGCPNCLLYNQLSVAHSPEEFDSCVGINCGEQLLSSYAASVTSKFQGRGSMEVTVVILKFRTPNFNKCLIILQEFHPLPSKNSSNHNGSLTLNPNVGVSTLQKGSRAYSYFPIHCCM